MTSGQKTGGKRRVEIWMRESGMPQMTAKIELMLSLSTLIPEAFWFNFCLPLFVVLNKLELTLNSMCGC